MKTYIIQADIHYSGDDSIYLEIQADSQEEAEKKFDNMDLGDIISFNNTDYDVDDFEIYTNDDDEDKSEPRCELTGELPL